MFLPITATPFSHSGYSELLPCKNLAPFVRCFWTTWNDGSNVNDFSSVIIPDACADIIISVDENESNSDEREISGMGFCGTTDKMFRSKNSGIVHRRLFGIRFYAWQAFNFCDEPLAETANGFFDLEEHFATAKKMLCRKIHEDMTLKGFLKTPFRFLLKSFLRLSVIKACGRMYAVQKILIFRMQFLNTDILTSRTFLMISRNFTA